MDLRRIVLAGVTGALMLAGTTTAYALEDGHRKHDGRADAVGSVHQEQNGNTQSGDTIFMRGFDTQNSIFLDGIRDLGAAVQALALRPSADESVVLSTCNRSEIYVVCSDPARAREEIASFLSEYHDLPQSAFTPHLFSHDNEAAARHLFRVAAGLDSLVVGEPQILGQVKDAFQAASEHHRTGPMLSKLFHWSFLVGKRVRAETALGEGAVSISFAAVALARKIFGQLNGRRVLVVGAGEISTLTAQHLRSNGVGEIVGMIDDYFSRARDSGYLEANRAAQKVHWLKETFDMLIRKDIARMRELNATRSHLEEMVRNDQVPVSKAARELLAAYHDAIRK